MRVFLDMRVLRTVKLSVVKLERLRLEWSLNAWSTPDIPAWISSTLFNTKPCCTALVLDHSVEIDTP